MIRNTAIEDESLNWDALGLLTYLLSKPDSWNIQAAHLAKIRKASRNTIYRMLCDLKKARYAFSKRLQSGKVDWYVFDEPYPKIWDEGKEPHPKKPHEGIWDVLVKTDFEQRLNIKHKSDSDEPDGFEEVWKARPKRPNESKVKARKAYLARLRESTCHADILAGVNRYRTYCEAQGTEPRFIKHLSTFLNSEEHWKLDWAVPEKVPDNIRDINKLVRERDLTLPENCNLSQARKEISRQTGMAL